MKPAVDCVSEIDCEDDVTEASRGTNRKAALCLRLT